MTTRAHPESDRVTFDLDPGDEPSRVGLDSKHAAKIDTAAPSCGCVRGSRGGTRNCCLGWHLDRALTKVECIELAPIAHLVLSCRDPVRSDEVVKRAAGPAVVEGSELGLGINTPEEEQQDCYDN